MCYFLRLLAIRMALVLPVFASSYVEADVIIGNLPGNDGLTFFFDSSSALSVGFTIGDNSITVSSIDFRLEAQSTSGSGVATLELRNNVGVNPSDVGFAFFNSQVISTGSVSQYSFIPIGTPVLAANTTYWLTLGTDLNGPTSDGAAGLKVKVNDPSVTPTGPYAAFAGLRTGEPDHQTVALVGPPFETVPSFQINGNVNATAVPEPSSVLWLTVAFALLFLARKGICRRAQCVV